MRITDNTFTTDTNCINKLTYKNTLRLNTLSAVAVFSAWMHQGMINGGTSMETILLPLLSGGAIGLLGASNLFGLLGDDEEETQETEELQEELSRSSSDTDVIEKVNQEDNDILTEASRRLEAQGEEITGENLTKEIQEIEEELQDEPSPTGLLDTQETRGPVARMSVSPEEVEPKNDHLIIKTASGEKKYVQTLFISSFPDNVRPGWLARLFSSGIETTGASVRASYKIYPQDTQSMIKRLNKQATKLTTQIKEKREQGDIDTVQEEQRRKKIDDLRKRMEKGATKSYDFAVYIQIVAEDKQTLIEGAEEAKQYISQSNGRLTPVFDQQMLAFRTVAPLGQDYLRKNEVMDLESLGTTMPFIEPTRIVPSGTLLGFHKTTNSPVIVDRFQLSGHNALVSGKIGSGKSYLTKLMMWRRIMMDPDVEMLIIDPVGGFRDLVDGLNGQIVTIDRSTTINPLDIAEVKANIGDLDENPYEVKIRSVMGMFNTLLDLTKGEEGILRRAVRWAYLEKGITKNPRTHSRESPIIQDVIDILQNISQEKHPKAFLDIDEEFEDFVNVVDAEVGGDRLDLGEDNLEREARYAHDVLLGLEEFTQGGQHEIFNGPTNVELKNKAVCFDISNVVGASDDTESLIMHIMLDYLFQRAKSADQRTMISIDEAHYLLRKEGPLSILNTFTRHSRHYNTGLTLISQTVDEYMEGKAKEIYDQCDIRVLMHHEDLGDEALEALDLTEPERDFVLDAQTGEDSDHSEALVHTSGFGKRRIRVYSSPYEHHVVDDDASHILTYLLFKEIIEWEDIPDEFLPRVKHEVQTIRKQQREEAL